MLPEVWGAFPHGEQVNKHSLENCDHPPKNHFINFSNHLCPGLCLAFPITWSACFCRMIWAYIMPLFPFNYFQVTDWKKMCRLTHLWSCHWSVFPSNFCSHSFSLISHSLRPPIPFPLLQCTTEMHQQATTHRFLLGKTKQTFQHKFVEFSSPKLILGYCFGGKRLDDQGGVGLEGSPDKQVF